jgi:hypothetical protein
VDIYVDGQSDGDRENVAAGSGTNVPGYDLTIGGKGGGTFMIKVCEAGTSSCSSEVEAAF